MRGFQGSVIYSYMSCFVQQLIIEWDYTACSRNTLIKKVGPKQNNTKPSFTEFAFWWIFILKDIFWELYKHMQSFATGVFGFLVSFILFPYVRHYQAQQLLLPYYCHTHSVAPSVAGVISLNRKSHYVILSSKSSWIPTSLRGKAHIETTVSKAPSDLIP